MTWTIKIRTSPGALMTAEYECPEHGRFEATVARDAAGDPPAEEMCGANTGIFCGRMAPWRISCGAIHTQFVISATQGKSAPKPHPKSMDTRMLAEGRKKDFRKQRQKIRQEERHARVKELLR